MLKIQSNIGYVMFVKNNANYKKKFTEKLIAFKKMSFFLSKKALLVLIKLHTCMFVIKCKKFNLT